MPRKNRAVEPLMLDARGVCDAINVSKSHLYRLIQTGRFPIGKRISPGCVRWDVEADVKPWCRSRPQAIEPRVVVRTPKGEPEGRAAQALEE